MPESLSISISSRPMTSTPGLSISFVKNSGVREFFVRRFEGRLRPKRSWAVTNSLAVMAAPVEISSARHAAAIISAKRKSLPGP